MFIVEIPQEISWVKNAQNIHSFDRICPFISLLSYFLVENGTLFQKVKKERKTSFKLEKGTKALERGWKGGKELCFLELVPIF